MRPSEESLTFLETQIPELAEAAMRQAYWEALNSGSSVLEYAESVLVEVFPDGRRVQHKSLPVQQQVTPGQRLNLA